MAACTICTLDPCPHLIIKGGSAGAPIIISGPIKYAPSSKPHCVYCDRVHRNIGTDNQPVCAWRTYSRAKGEDFAAFTPDAVDEFARWYRSGGWAAPARKAKVPRITSKTPVPGPTSVASASSGSTPSSAPAPTISIPSVVDFEEGPIEVTPRDVEILLEPKTITVKEPPREPRKAPSFARTTDINEEAVVITS